MKTAMSNIRTVCLSSFPVWLHIENDRKVLVENKYQEKGQGRINFKGY